MSQYLVRAWGPSAEQASPAQLASMQRCCEQLGRDQRVRSLYGIPAQPSDLSVAFGAIVEAPNAEEAQRVAALAQQGGFTSTHVTPLSSAEQLQASLAEAQRHSAHSTSRSA